jgi:hypothetical protein
MTFRAATGWNNLPNGVWSPVIYSKKVQKTFRKKSVVQAITNSDYFGEIASMGDSVRIIKEPEITVVPYARGAKVVPQDLVDSDFTLVVDQATYWSFKVDDIEDAQSHINWQDLATNRGAYKMADAFDREVLGYMAGYLEVTPGSGTWTARTTFPGTKAWSDAGSDEYITIHQLNKGSFSTSGTATNSIPMGVTGTFDATPLQILARMDRLLNEQNVDTDNRFVVVDPVFLELLGDENSKYMNRDYSNDTNGPGLHQSNGLMFGGDKIRGFSMYLSNNLPTFGTGDSTINTAGSASNYGVVLAGHKSAVATAENLSKSETIRSADTFGDIFRAMHVYGRKILRPEGLIRAIWNASK